MPAYTIGLDLGQANDYSALAIVEHVFRLPIGGTYRPNEPNLPSHRRAAEQAVREYHVRALRRWERGTTYPSVVNDVVTLLASETLQYDAQLLYDATGVGRAVGDLLLDSCRGRMRMPWPVTFTLESKQNMMANVQIPLQQGRLRFTPNDPLMDELTAELPRFQQKITATGRTTFDIARDEGGHGDIATALMIAMFYGDWVPFGSPRFIAAEEAS